jgi:hypothetical protein
MACILMLIYVRTKVMNINTGWVNGAAGSLTVSENPSGITWNEMLIIDYGSQGCYMYSSSTCQYTWAYG